mmetsp:Transcript_27078/g.74452  ORF Transcript_27078/g.74452 Transcript_27078/m.74452 type:complete len:227 (-) Transcript_27078:15-695(-)
MRIIKAHRKSNAGCSTAHNKEHPFFFSSSLVDCLVATMSFLRCDPGRYGPNSFLRRREKLWLLGVSTCALSKVLTEGLVLRLPVSIELCRLLVRRLASASELNALPSDCLRPSSCLSCLVTTNGPCSAAPRGPESCAGAAGPAASGPHRRPGPAAAASFVQKQTGEDGGSTCARGSELPTSPMSSSSCSALSALRRWPHIALAPFRAQPPRVPAAGVAAAAAAATC